jgi:hypothetical protein
LPVVDDAGKAAAQLDDSRQFAAFKEYAADRISAGFVCGEHT